MTGSLLGVSRCPLMMTLLHFCNHNTASDWQLSHRALNANGHQKLCLLYLIPSPQSEVLIAKPQAKPLFVDKRYHLPSLSQGTLAGVREMRDCWCIWFLGRGSEMMLRWVDWWDMSLRSLAAANQAALWSTINVIRLLVNLIHIRRKRVSVHLEKNRRFPSGNVN